MELKTKIPVTYNSGIASQEQGIVSGKLRICMQDLFSDTYNFNYNYKTDSGVDLGSNNFNLSKDEINSIFQYVKTELPTDLSYTDSVLYLYYLGMRIKMAETFGISIDDIEIIM